MIFDKEKVLKAIIEAGHTELYANSIVESYEKMNLKIQEALNEWISNKTIKYIEVEGVTIEFIMEKKKCSFYSAITDMDVFIDKPELAKKFKEKPIFFRGRR